MENMDHLLAVSMAQSVLASEKNDRFDLPDEAFRTARKILASVATDEEITAFWDTIYEAQEIYFTNNPHEEN